MSKKTKISTLVGLEPTTFEWPHFNTCFGLCKPFTVRSVGMKDKVLGSLRSWSAVRKAEALTGPKVQDRTHKAKQQTEKYRWDSNPGSPVYKTVALTS